MKQSNHEAICVDWHNFVTNENKNERAKILFGRDNIVPLYEANITDYAASGSTGLNCKKNEDDLLIYLKVIENEGSPYLEAIANESSCHETEMNRMQKDDDALYMKVSEILYVPHAESIANRAFCCEPKLNLKQNFGKSSNAKAIDCENVSPQVKLLLFVIVNSIP